MSREIVHMSGQHPVTTSLIIAEGVGNPHASVIRLVRDNQADLEEFGLVGFEIQPRRPGQHGGGDIEYAVLNEQQATLLLTYMRNSDVVRQFKKSLVKAFYDLAHAARNAPAQLSRREILQLALDAEAEAEQAKARIAELQPLADTWQTLAEASGDLSVRDAAQVLCRDHGIEIGQNRLFKHLRDTHRPWLDRNSRPYQWAVDAGLVVEKLQHFMIQRTQGSVLAPPQVRITAKGLERLRADLTSTGLRVVS